MKKKSQSKEYKNSPEAVLKNSMEALIFLRKNSCSLDDYLDQFSGDALMRKRLTSVLFASYRYRKQIEAALKKVCSKAPAPEVKELLLCALVMAKYQDALAAQSVANIAVTLAKKEFNEFTARFVNAVLRKCLTLLDTVQVDPLPNRIGDRWKKAFTREIYSELQKLYTRQYGSTVRLRSGFEISEELKDDLEPLLLDLPWKFFLCKNLSRLLQSSDFAAGKFYIQDPAPAHVCSLLAKHIELLPEDINFLDLCAAPGGKFIMNSELLIAKGKNLVSATAFDRSSRRLELVKNNTSRCNIKCDVQVGDAADLKIFPDRKFDFITCDVPCSNSGVFRRRPDALWRWSVEDMREVAELQKNILENAARLTVPGGLLLYSTCSLEAEENDLQISKFLEKYSEFELVEEKLFMPDEDCDGTYAALLHRKNI